MLKRISTIAIVSVFLGSMVCAEESTNPYIPVQEQEAGKEKLSAEHLQEDSAPEELVEEIEVQESDIDKYLSLYELQLTKEQQQAQEQASQAVEQVATEIEQGSAQLVDLDQKSFVESHMNLTVRNELPETITVKIRSAEIGLRTKELNADSENQNDGVYLSAAEKEYHENFFQEIYINPYQTVSLQDVHVGRYAIEVFDISNKLIGYTQKSLDYNDVRNDHLTINRFTLRTKMRQAVNIASPKMLALGRELLSKRKEQREASKESVTRLIANANNNIKRRIKLSNISSKVHHIEIREPESQSIGSGWTIPRGLYKPEYLTFQSEPIQITSEADLSFELRQDGETVETYMRKAKDLSIDSEGDFILVIEPR